MYYYHYMNNLEDLLVAYRNYQTSHIILKITFRSRAMRKSYTTTTEELTDRGDLWPRQLQECKKNIFKCSLINVMNLEFQQYLYDFSKNLECHQCFYQF